MNVPNHLRYTHHHLWLETQPDGTVRTGITDHAQGMLGDIVFADSPAAGAAINIGQPCGTIESVKTASDLHAPLSGTIVAVNADIQHVPEHINDAPYAAWIFAIRPANTAELAQLLDANSYRKLIET